MRHTSDQIFDQNIPADLLPSCEEDLQKILKYDRFSEDQNIRVIVRELMVQALANMDIRVGYRIFENSSVRIEKNRICCEHVVFDCDVSVAEQMQGTSGLIIFAATLGHDFDNWSRNFFNLGDPFSGYIVDVIGSLKVEQAIDWLDEKISLQFVSQELNCTNRYSPGYCGWDVFEQHKLFSLLPEGFLDIILHPSALMTPIKSVSGIIGVGKDVERMPYTCAFCSQENCFMRRNKNGQRITLK